jgi:hypothetical protein
MIFTIAKVEVRLFFTKRKMIFGDFFGKWDRVWNKNIEGGRGMGVGKKKCIMSLLMILVIKTVGTKSFLITEFLLTLRRIQKR